MQEGSAKSHDICQGERPNKGQQQAAPWKCSALWQGQPMLASSASCSRERTKQWQKAVHKGLDEVAVHLQG